MNKLENRNKIRIDEPLNDIYQNFFNSQIEQQTGVSHKKERHEAEILNFKEFTSHHAALSTIHSEMQSWAMEIERLVRNSGSKTISEVIDSLANNYLARAVSVATGVEAAAALETLNLINNALQWVKKQLIEFFKGFRELVVGYKLNPKMSGSKELQSYVESGSLKDIVISEATSYYTNKFEKYKMDTQQSVKYMVNAVLVIIEDCISLLRRKLV